MEVAEKLVLQKGFSGVSIEGGIILSLILEEKGF